MTPLPEVLCSQANIQLPTRDQGQAGWHASQGVRTGTFTCVGANKSQEDISIFIYTWNPPMGVGMSIFQHLKLPWESFELFWVGLEIIHSHCFGTDELQTCCWPSSIQPHQSTMHLVSDPKGNRGRIWNASGLNVRPKFVLTFTMRY